MGYAKIYGMIRPYFTIPKIIGREIRPYDKYIYQAVWVCVYECLCVCVCKVNIF